MVLRKNPGDVGALLSFGQTGTRRSELLTSELPMKFAISCSIDATFPRTPVKPVPPEVAKKLFTINSDFRARKNQFFANSSRLNWLSCIAALMLVGGMIYLLMFDTNGQRWHYLVALMISFVFLIGPAFHSIMAGIMGFLEGPGVY